MKMEENGIVSESGERSLYEDHGKWARGKILGEGGFSSVYLATFPTPRASYFNNFPEIAAVKSSELSEAEELSIEKELFERLRDCPFVVKYLGYDVTKCKEKKWMVNLFLEYAAGGTLVDLANNNEGNRLPEPQVRRFARSILGGIERIHREGFVHCDIKLDNVLLVADGDSPYVAKLADLGLAKREEQRSSPGGTPENWAPEVFQHGVQGKAADVWALGCIVMEMLTGEPMWGQDLNEQELARLIATTSPALPRGSFSDAAESFLSQCFQKNPEDRPSAAVLLDHPFVSQTQENPNPT